MAYNLGMENETYKLTTELDISLYTLDSSTPSSRWLDWQEYDKGPGFFTLPVNLMLGVRARYLDDKMMRTMVEELAPVSGLRYLYLAENRGVTDHSAQFLSKLTQLRYLNLSACDIDSDGMAFLPALTNLEYLNLSYCNRISDRTATFVQKLRKLTYLDLHGCPRINTGGLKKFEKRGLTIYKP